MLAGYKARCVRCSFYNPVLPLSSSPHASNHSPTTAHSSINAALQQWSDFGPFSFLFGVVVLCYGFPVKRHRRRRAKSSSQQALCETTSPPGVARSLRRGKDRVDHRRQGKFSASVWDVPGPWVSPPTRTQCLAKVPHKDYIVPYPHVNYTNGFPLFKNNSMFDGERVPFSTGTRPGAESWIRFLLRSHRPQPFGTSPDSRLFLR